MVIKFNNSRKDQFYKELTRRVNQALHSDNLLFKAKLLLWTKLIFYAMLFGSTYYCLLTQQITSWPVLVALYILLGGSGILLAFNSAHDAAHATFSRKKWVNNLIYQLTFNLQGVNAYLWKIRHISSHHIFTNVDGCDADIDDNILLKLSPSRASRPFHRYQHWYATLLYACYTLHWIFIKDFKYLRKKELANLKDLKHPPLQVVLLFLWKAFYLFYMIALPVWLGYSPGAILSAFIVMHLVISLFFVWSLIISHFTVETHFPIQNAEGVLPFNFAQHQLSVSMDYYPTSYLANWIYGGFNSHAAHHLFPHLPHPTYVIVSEIIEETCREFNYPYHQLPILEAIKSHYRFLKQIGNKKTVTATRA